MKYLRQVSPFIALAMGTALSACTPSGIPKDASHEWTFLTASIWYWGDKLPTGCTAWMGNEDWASVRLTTDPHCTGDERPDEVNGKLVSYLSGVDQLEFNDYGPWSHVIYDGVRVLNAQGEFVGFKPCPHEISSEDISKIKALSREAFAIATTDGEKRIMERIISRFETVDLSALSSVQYGCTDSPLNMRVQDSLDVWRE